MKIFVTGVNGQLGHDVVNEAVGRGYKVIGSDITEKYNGVEKKSAIAVADYVPMDITDRQSVENILQTLKPDVVIHCSAWTAVDLAEEEQYRQQVYDVNYHGTENIAHACKRIQAKMIYISTDYVFDGTGVQSWRADCQEFSPQNIYGDSKLQGELSVSRLLEKYFIVRIAWVFGINGKNFVRTMLNVGKKYDTVKVVNDQIGTPTYTFDLAKLLIDMSTSTKYGYYHATNEGGYISWYDFTCEIYRQAGYTTTVIPVTTEEYGLSKAKRPKNSRLDKSKLKENGFSPLPDWKDAVGRYLKEINQN
ncbi:MAG: dTDP-4-dehydrorhamnose reductase [Clostridia bacterium]|nr:dTDP-4-dehydrorhamnose reductase [Clostridia bacterium]